MRANRTLLSSLAVSIFAAIIQAGPSSLAVAADTAAPEPEQPTLLYSKDNSTLVVQTFLNTKKLEINSPNAPVVGISHDAWNEYVYWSTVNPGTISRAKFDGSRYEVLVQSVVGLEAPAEIALDWITGNIYIGGYNLTVPGSGAISVCSNKGTSCTKIVDGPYVGSLALDPNEGTMLWTLASFDDSAIWKAGMDGSSPRKLIDEPSTPSFPFGVAMDLQTSKIYWTDSGNGGLWMSDENGENITNFLQYVYGTPYGIQMHNSRYFYVIYFWDYDISQFISESRVGDTIVHWDGPAVLNRRIAVSGKENQPRGRGNDCAARACSHVCVLVNEGAKCLCPQDMILGTDGENCGA